MTAAVLQDRGVNLWRCRRAALQLWLALALHVPGALQGAGAQGCDWLLQALWARGLRDVRGLALLRCVGNEAGG